MLDYPLSSPARRTQRSAESPPQWPCLLPSIAVAVAPLRNLTDDPEQQSVVEDFTDRLVAELFRHCRGFSFAWLSREPRWAANLAPPDPPELKYVVSGSVQRGSTHGMLRVNLRISDAVTADYLWAGREEFRCEEGGLRMAVALVDATGTSKSTNIRLPRRKSSLFQWIAVPLWFPTHKDSLPTDSGHSVPVVLDPADRLEPGARWVN